MDIFYIASKPMSSGLFGSQNQTQGQPSSTGGGLFGSSTSTSKFGGAQPTGGIFGGTTSSTSSFGQKSKSSSKLVFLRIIRYTHF